MLHVEGFPFFTKGGKCLAHIQRLSSRRGTSTKPKEQNKAGLKANLPSTMLERCFGRYQSQEKQLILYILSLFIWALEVLQVQEPKWPFNTWNHKNLWFTYCFLSDPNIVLRIIPSFRLLGWDCLVTNGKPRKLETCWKTLNCICLHQCHRNHTLYFSFMCPWIKCTVKLLQSSQLCLEKFNNKWYSSTQWGLFTTFVLFVH